MGIGECSENVEIGWHLRDVRQTELRQSPPGVLQQSALLVAHQLALYLEQRHLVAGQGWAQALGLEAN